MLPLVQDSNIDVRSNTVIETGVFLPLGKDLVLNDTQYNLDSVGLINKGLNKFVTRVNSNLMFSDISPKATIKIDTPLLYQQIGEVFSTNELLKDALRATESKQDCYVFPILGHTSDSFYFTVRDDIITELIGYEIDRINGVIALPYVADVTRVTEIYGIFNVTKLNLLELGTPSLVKASGFLRYDYYTTPYSYSIKPVFSLPASGAYYDFTVQSDVILEFNLEEGFFDIETEQTVQAYLTIDGVEVLGGNHMYLKKGRYLIGIGTTLQTYEDLPFMYDYSNIIQQYKDSHVQKDEATFIEASSIVNGVETITNLHINAVNGFTIYYLNSTTKEIDAKESLYIYPSTDNIYPSTDNWMPS